MICVGGPYNGEIYLVQEGLQYLNLPEPYARPASVFDAEDPWPKVRTIKVHRYYRRTAIDLSGLPVAVWSYSGCHTM